MALVYAMCSAVYNGLFFMYRDSKTGGNKGRQDFAKIRQQSHYVLSNR